MLTNILKSLLQPHSQAPVYCRICLRPNKDLHPLDSCLNFGFDVDSVEKLSLQHLLKDVSGCEAASVGSIDGLCELCLEGLITAYHFRKRCLHSDETIRNVLDLLEKIIDNTETAGPTTAILAQVSLVTNDIRLWNYESHEKNSSSIRFINEIIEPEISKCENRENIIGSEYPTAKNIETSEKGEKILPFRCEFCGKCFLYLSSMKHHRQYHGERTHMCERCPKSFKTHNDLKRHLRSHDAKMYFNNLHMKCHRPSLIKQRGSSLKDYLKQIRSKSQDGIDKTDTEKVLCPVCGKLIIKRTLPEHLEIHGDRNYCCTVCDEKFKTKHSLYMHNFKHIPPSQKNTYECHHCGVTRSLKSVLATHLKVHEPIKEKVLCPHCGKLIGKTTLSVHLEIHGDRKYCCTVCDKKFKTKSSLYKHNFKHIPPSQKNAYACHHCGVTRKSKSALAVHLKVHEPKGTYTCIVCNKVFAREIYLKNHKLTHLNIRPEKCDICGIRFVNKKALLYHRRIHTGERPYECEICGQKFVSSSRRNEHITRSHTEKRMSCTICGFLFHTQSEINRHMKDVHLKIRRKRNVVNVKLENE